MVILTPWMDGVDREGKIVSGVYERLVFNTPYYRWRARIQIWGPSDGWRFDYFDDDGTRHLSYDTNTFFKTREEAENYVDKKTT